MSICSLLAALAVVAPPDGSVVSAQKPLRLAWRGETNAVYLLSIVRAGRDPQVFAISNRTEAYVGNLELGSRFDWTVRAAGTADGVSAHFVSESEPPRLLRAGGVRDFRDFGGWRAAGGRRVRQNRILLSATLRGAVRADGVAVLCSDFGVRTDVDLQPTRGMKAMRGSALGEDVAWKNVPFGVGKDIDKVVDGRESFAQVVGLLSDEKSYPVLLQDAPSSGRRDTLVFLLNGLLGVAEDDLRRNWTASRKALDELTAYLQMLPGKTLSARIESYARGCGIADAEIEAFRSLMLEEAK